MTIFNQKGLRMPVIKTITLSVVAVLAVSLSGLGVNYVFGQDVALTVDGETTTVSVVHNSVAEVLAAQGIELADRDWVTPDLKTLVGEDTEIKVEYARPINLTLNGKTGVYWTHATTVAGILDGLGLGSTSLKLSAPSDTAVPREGMDLSIATASNVSVQADGENSEVHSFGTVRNALSDLGLTWTDTDIISPPLNSALTDDLEISLVRVEVKTITRKKSIAFSTKNTNDPNSYKGDVTVVKKGVKGQKSQTVEQVLHDGKVTKETVLGETVTRKPVTQVTRTGTKVVSVKVSPGSAQAIAKEMVLARGWNEKQFQCLHSLWQRESGWRVTAGNRYSGAYGIPQALPGSKMASAGADWRTNPATQIKWGLGYIKGRYGTPCNAWSHFLNTNWY